MIPFPSSPLPLAPLPHWPVPCPMLPEDSPTAFIPSEEILFPSVLDSFSLGPSSRLWEEVKNAWNVHPPWPAPQPPAELSLQSVPLRNCWTLGLDKRGEQRTKCRQAAGCLWFRAGPLPTPTPDPIWYLPPNCPVLAASSLSAIHPTCSSSVGHCWMKT